MRTESAYVENAAQARAYDEAGIEKYRFVAALDKRTSEVCATLDGKVFELSKAKAGTNYPPMHPFCRSTTIADFGDEELAGLERRAKDENGNTVKVPADMTYQEWYGKYVEGIEQPNSGSRETETAALSVGRQMLIAEHQTAPALLTADNSGGQTLTNVLNSGKISTRIFNPVPQSQVVNILRQDSDDWIDLLTDEELRAVRKYTKNSGDTSRPFFYERLNAMLRGAIPEDSRLRYFADTISSALKKNTLKHDILCYRRDITDIFAGLSKGDEFVIHSFFSTSATPKGALNKGILCKIHIPAGAEGAYIEQLSSFPNQREFLLDKGQKYRVLSRKDDLIELEVVINE